MPTERAYGALWSLANLWAMRRDYVPFLAHRAEQYLAGFDFGPPEQPKISGGIAIMPMIGALTPRGDMGTVSTMRFEAFFREAIKNPGIKAVMLDLDSPGGVVYYTPQLAKRIYDARGSKPVVAFGNGSVGSAAYWIASAAERFVLAPGAEAGSVGVWMAHQDMSKALEQQGVNVSIISYGENKLEGSELAPLSEESRAYMQARVNELGAEFESDVARNRSVGVSHVRKEFGQGRMFSAKEALSRGMVDAVASADKVLKDLMGTNVSGYTRKAGAAADAALCHEWMAASEALFTAEQDAAAPIVLDDPGQFVAGGDPDLLRRKLALKERA